MDRPVRRQCEAHRSGGDGLHDARVEQVFHAKHTRRERMLVVAVTDGNGPLRDHGTVVVDVVHEMHRHAGLACARGEHGTMHARAVHPRATEVGKQRGMHVEQASRELLVTSEGTNCR